MFMGFIRILAVHYACLVVMRDKIRDLKSDLSEAERYADELADEVCDLGNEADDRAYNYGDLQEKTAELLSVVKEIAEPGEHGSLKQRAWELYHANRHLEVKG